jgi:abequosyltransferase
MTADIKPLISFAIPTFNFGRFIAETLLTIEEGAEVLAASQFEIVVLDGGSTDNTAEVVSTLAARYGNIRYIKRSERGGIDHDLNLVAEMAIGQYIWLFSADDLLERGWDRHIIPLIKDAGELFLIPAILCDIGMSPMRVNPIFRECIMDEPTEFLLSLDESRIADYLNRAVTLEAFFSYMSAVIVKAEVWHKLPVRADYFGTCWAHCARLMPMLFGDVRVTYLNKYLIKKRSGNDSFMAGGFVARIAIAVDGWDRLITEFFQKTSHKTLLYNALRKDMPIMLFLYAKISSANNPEIVRLNNMARLLYVERNSTFTTKAHYFLFRLVPASAFLNMLLKPFLPSLIRLRHKIKSMFLS